MAEPSAEFWEDARVPGMAEDVAERIAKSPYAIREGETFEEYDARCKAMALAAKRQSRSRQWAQRRISDGFVVPWDRDQQGPPTQPTPDELAAPLDGYEWVSRTITPWEPHAQ